MGDMTVPPSNKKTQRIDTPGNPHMTSVAIVILGTYKGAGEREERVVEGREGWAEKEKHYVMLAIS